MARIMKVRRKVVVLTDAELDEQAKKGPKWAQAVEQIKAGRS